jgi:uncharacterized surface protein with fasciclin (FAS1) repeats
MKSQMLKAAPLAAVMSAALAMMATTPALAGGGCTDTAANTASTNPGHGRHVATPVRHAVWTGDAAHRAAFQTVGYGQKKKTATPVSSGTIVDVAVGAGQFGTLVAAVQAAGLVPTLSGPGPFTVFAPTDAAFAKLPAGTVDTLLRPENRAQLTAILTYHVVPGRVLAADLAGRTAAPATVQGATVAVDGRMGVKVNNATVTTADVMASNGVIHVIDTVLMPPTTR